MSVTKADCQLADTLERHTHTLVLPREARVLRLAQRRLHNWCELCCGDNIGGVGRVLERDDDTGRPYMVYYFANKPPHQVSIPDTETGALQRIKDVCDKLGMHYYYQTDPRGCALYVSHEPLNDTNYTSGIPCL